MPLLLTGPLLIFNLYINPGGLAGWAFEKRDKWLRRSPPGTTSTCPSLVADRLVEAEPDDRRRRGGRAGEAARAGAASR